MCWNVINSVHLTLCFYCSWQLEELTNVALHRGYRAPWTRSEQSCFCSGSWSVWTAVRKSRAVCTTLALARGVPASPDPDPDPRGGHVVDSDPDPDPRGGHGVDPDPNPDHRGRHVVDPDPDPDPRGGHGVDPLADKFSLTPQVPIDTLLCPAMLCPAMPCYVMSCYVMSCYSMH